MPRAIDPSTLTAIMSNSVRLAHFVQIQFLDQTIHVSSLPCSYTLNGVTWTGVGTLGEVGAISESGDIMAQGITVSLSGLDMHYPGVDPSMINEALNEIQSGAPATVYLGCLDSNNNLIGSLIPLYSGFVDKSSVSVNASKVTLTLNIESAMIKLGHGQMRRYTSADQQLTHSDDTAFMWVESLQDIVLRYGS